MLTFFCKTLTCVQMYTGVTPVYIQTTYAYLSNTQKQVTYCKRYQTQYVCEYLSSASSSALEGSVPRIGSFMD